MRKRNLLMVAFTAIGVLMAPSGAQAATPATVFTPLATPNPEPQTGGRWGERLAVANDENGDGVKDIFTATPSADGSFPDQGRVYLLSGKDRSILRAIDSPEPQGGTAFGFPATSGAKFGFFISVPGDLNGDGKDDVVVGTDAQNVYTGTGTPCGAPEPNGCNERQGKAWSFSGATGKLLRTFDNPDPQGTPTNTARFGSRIGSAGDVTRDGVPDIVIGASNNDVPAGCGDTAVAAGCFKNEGQAYIFNGSTGALVRTLSLPPADRNGASSCGTAPPATGVPCGTLGLAVQSPGDVTGDGVPDQLVDAANYTPPGGLAGVGRMYVFDGATGSVKLRIDDPVPQAGATFGFQDVPPDSPGDVNADGVPDLYAHGFDQNGPAPANLRQQGRGWVFSGKDGKLLYTIDDPTPTEGGTFGFSMSRTDYNKDATPDLYIGQAPHGGGDENGGTYVVDGRDGSLLKALELPVADLQTGTATPPDGGPSLGFSSAAAADLNGDGEPDYLGGAPFFNENGVQDNGRIYAFMSTRPQPTTGTTPSGTGTGTGTTPNPGTTPPVTPPKTQIVPTVVPRVAVAGFTAALSPRRDRRSPYRFTVSGRLRRPTGIAASACNGGRVSVQVKVGAKTISTRRVTLRADCSYRLAVTFANKRRLGRGRLTVRVRFLGNARFKPAQARTLFARAG